MIDGYAKGRVVRCAVVIAGFLPEGREDSTSNLPVATGVGSLFTAEPGRCIGRRPGLQPGATGGHRAA